MPTPTTTEFKRVLAYMEKAAIVRTAKEQYVAAQTATEAAIKKPETLDESSLAILQEEIKTAKEILAQAWNLIGDKDRQTAREKEASAIENPVIAGGGVPKKGVLKKIKDRRDEVRKTLGQLRGRERDVQLVLLRSEIKALHTAKQYRDDPQLADNLDKVDPAVWWEGVSKALENGFERDKKQMEADMKNEKQGARKIKDYIAELDTLQARLLRAAKEQEKKAAPAPAPKAAPKSIVPRFWKFYLPQGSPGISVVGPGAQSREGVAPGSITKAPRLPTAAELAAQQATMATSGEKTPQF